jgi:hypothetical protein
MKVSQRLLEYLCRFASSGKVGQLEMTQQKHYGRVIYTVCDLNKILAGARSSTDRTSTEGVALFEGRWKQLEIWRHWIIA